VIKTGASLLARGVRRGNPPLSFLGAAVLAFGVVRTMNRPKRELVWSRTLRPGQAVNVVAVKGGT
jgi:hypothetical protein